MSAIVSENPTLNRQKIRPPYLVTLIKNKRSPALPSRESEVLLSNHTGSLINFGLSSQSEFIVPALQEFCNIIDIPTEIKIGIIGASFIKTVGIISHHITGVIVLQSAVSTTDIVYSHLNLYKYYSKCLPSKLAGTFDSIRNLSPMYGASVFRCCLSLFWGSFRGQVFHDL